MHRGLLQQRRRAPLRGRIPHLLAPVPRQGAQRIGRGQRLQVLPVLARAQGQVLHAGEGACGPCAHEPGGRLGPVPGHQAQAQPHRGLRLLQAGQRHSGPFEGAVPVAVRGIGGQHAQPVAAGIMHELGRACRNPWAAN